MALQEVKFHLKSECPMLMHAGTMIDPLHPMAKRLKQVSGKKNKTDADHLLMSEVEFLAGLYVTSGVGVSLPAENVERMLIEAAKKSRSGKTAAAGMYVAEDAKLIFEGPQDPAAMWECGLFSHRKAARVGQARVMRTRPIFQKWEAGVAVSFDDEIISLQDIVDWVAIAGRYIGFGDWRPRFGRFSSEVVN